MGMVIRESSNKLTVTLILWYSLWVCSHPCDFAECVDSLMLNLKSVIMSWINMEWLIMQFMQVIASMVRLHKHIYLNCQQYELFLLLKCFFFSDIRYSNKCFLVICIFHINDLWRQILIWMFWQLHLKSKSNKLEDHGAVLLSILRMHSWSKVVHNCLLVSVVVMMMNVHILAGKMNRWYIGTQNP